MLLELWIEPWNESSWLLEIDRPLVAIAGFTGRDPESVAEHIRELKEVGVPEPTEVPATYLVPDWTIAQANGGVQVIGERGSGEAEPVMIVMPDGGMYVTVGSDHTDRALERTSIALAKRTQPKVIARRAWPYSEVQDHWDDLLLRSWVGRDGDLYQENRLAVLAPPMTIVARVRERLDMGGDQQPLIIFLGTVPLRGEFRFDGGFHAALEDPEHDRQLTCTYTATPIDTPRSTPVT